MVGWALPTLNRVNEQGLVGKAHPTIEDAVLGLEIFFHGFIFLPITNIYKLAMPYIKFSHKAYFQEISWLNKFSNN
jgi:hypothetical protein